MTEECRLRAQDWTVLVIFCLLLFGFAMVSGRPLSMHEAVLPESAHEMLHDGDWIVPKKGGEPWLESPPLPQWVTTVLAAPFGRCNTELIARIGPTLAATAVVLLLAWMSTLWFGRRIGLLSGLILATTCEFTRYAWLSEDEIFLCLIITACVAVFVWIEFPQSCYTQTSNAKTPQPPSADTRVGDPTNNPNEVSLRFFGRRSWKVTLFFLLLGMTNLAKGLFFGTVLVGTAVGGFLLLTGDLRRIRRYVWFWGWLLFLLMAAAWPLAAYSRYPDVLDLWFFDLGGRLTGDYAAINQPVWYYPVNLLWMLAPWTLVVPFGLKATARRAVQEPESPERFLWCWAMLVPLVFTLPHGKHHHYMLHALAPWAPIAAFGLLKVREWTARTPERFKHPAWSLLTLALPATLTLFLLKDRLPNPPWLTYTVLAICPFLALLIGWGTNHRNDTVAAATLFGVLALGYGFGHWYAGRFVDKYRLDARFLQQVNQLVPSDKPLVLDMSMGAHRSFLCLFYLEDRAIPIHNLSFLRDDRIRANTAFVVTLWSHRQELSKYGRWRLVAESPPGFKQRPKPERLCLFELTYNDSTRMSSKNVRVSPMQAIDRADGPWLEPGGTKVRGRPSNASKDQKLQAQEVVSKKAAQKDRQRDERSSGTETGEDSD